MTSGGNRINESYLKPGEAIISDKPSTVSTVLGSCISVTMFNSQYCVGGICHSLLPSCRDRDSCVSTCTGLFRYVECTIESMVRDFLERRIDLHRIEVKLFGGSDMFSLYGLRNEALFVGMKNTEIALRTLGGFGLKPVTSDTGGSLGRKIIFCTHTGKVYLKRLYSNEIKECCNG